MKAVASILVGMLLAVAALAQSTDETYRLKPEDVLRIMVYNEAQVNAEVPVGSDGNISAPFVGTVHAEGMTTSELEVELAKLYVKYLRLRDPIVSVTISRFRVLRASVGGFVNRPGQFDIRPGDTVMTLLDAGGGPISDHSDLRKATLRRANSKELIPIDLYSMLYLGDTSQNYVLQDGDELTIPEETVDRILVQGAVLQPGLYPYKEPMTLADAISLAHGEIRLRSRLSRTVIMRPIKGQPGKYLTIKADYVRFVRKGDASQNVVLQPGDLVFVPETNSPDLQQIASTFQTILNTYYGFRLLR